MIDKEQLLKIMKDLKEVTKTFTDSLEKEDGIRLPLDFDTLFKESCEMYREGKKCNNKK